MATVTVTNQLSNEAFEGASSIVTLNSTDAAKLASLSIGQKCTITSSNKVGYIASIDKFGNTFKVNPAQPNFRFDSTSTPGILNATETITII